MKIKHLILGLLASLSPFIAHAQAANFWYPSGTNLTPVVSTWGLKIPSLPNKGCIGTDVNGVFQTGVCAGGSGGGSWSTTTSQVSGHLINYSTNNTDLVSIGGSSTSTAKFYFDPNISQTIINGLIKANNASTTQLTFLGPVYGTDNSIGTAGNILMDTASGAKWVASTTFSSPLLYSAGNVTCQTATGSVPGCLSAADWTTFNGKGSGTVTAVSVASSNGLAGSSSGGATPALTLSTSVTGVVKGNGTSFLAAANGIDYTLLNTTTCTSGNVVNAVTSTGSVTCGAAFSTTSADAYINASTTIAHPGGIASGNVIQWDGTEWVSVATSTLGLGGSGGGSVTSVAMTVPTFLSISGSPITTSGTLAVSLSGTALPVANGGTGLTSTGASSTILTTNGTTPAWQNVSSYIYGLFGASSPISYNNTTGSIGLNTVPIAKGGTNTTTIGASSTVALSNGTALNYMATSSLGLQKPIVLTTTGSSGASTFDGTTLNIPQYSGGGGAYPFALSGNATSTLTQFNGGLTAYASTTIGSGTGTGLTVNGNAVTTGTLAVNGTATSTIAGTTTIQNALYVSTTTPVNLTQAPAFGVSSNNTIQIGTTTTTGVLNIGSDPGTSTTTIMVGKLQLDGYSASGSRVCAEVIATAWVITSGACNP